MGGTKGYKKLTGGYRSYLGSGRLRCSHCIFLLSFSLMPTTFSSLFLFMYLRYRYLGSLVCGL